MTRSRKHTPITGNMCCRSEKYDKVLAHQAWRSRLKAWCRGILHGHVDAEAEVPPLPREVADVWDFGKDGKQYFDPKKRPEAMRK